MAAAKKGRKTLVKTDAAESAPVRAELKLFYDGGGRHENFSFTRVGRDHLAHMMHDWLLWRLAPDE